MDSTGEAFVAAVGVGRGSQLDVEFGHGGETRTLEDMEAFIADHLAT